MSSSRSPEGPALTITELTKAVSGNVTPRMVRHYHKIGLLPNPARSPSNYRLYTRADVGRLQRIVALKGQGFRLSHIKEILDAESPSSSAENLTAQLRDHYQSVLKQLAQLRQTASALEGLLGRDRSCQERQAEALAQLRLLEAETRAERSRIEDLWGHFDAGVAGHPENFREGLQQLLPDLSGRSAIEIDLISQLILACGDVSLAYFVRLSPDAIKAARSALQGGCTVVADVPPVVAALDTVRLTHLGCEWTSAIADPHVETAMDAEREFWQTPEWHDRLQGAIEGNIFVCGYAPSILMKLCESVEAGRCKPALAIGMPLGFSHAPAAKRRLMSLSIPHITTEGTLGGGLLAAVALNSLAASLIEKPHCHCYLGE